MRESNGKALDALIVLGCRIGADGLGDAAERRVATAAAAFGELATRRVIVSGGRRWRGVAEADAMSQALAKRGVGEAALVRELCSVSTIENAVYCAELCRAGGFERLGVVTCDWHMPRALLCFDLVGLRPVPIPAVSPLEPRARLKVGIAERVRCFIDRRVAAQWIAP